MLNRIAFAFIALFIAGPAFAQNSSLAQLHLVVVDQTGAGIPAATITLTPAGGGSPLTGVSDERGVAELAGAPIGTATLHVEFPGFLPTDQQVTLKRGGNNQNVELKIEGFSDQVVVSDTTASDDQRGHSMSTTLEESEIAELPEDPDDLEAYLTQMAGGAGAVFQVNGFRGGRLPSKDEIQQIRFRTNSFSADNHDPGRTQIEIITKPNVKNWSGNVGTQYRNDAMNARNAFAKGDTPEENHQFNLGLRGPLGSSKTSVRFNVDGRRDMQGDTIVALDELGNRLGDFVRRPSDSTNVTVGVEHALTNTETLRVEFRGGTSSSRNNGVGGFNLAERATNREGNNQQVRVQLQGVVGKNALNDIHLQYNGANSTVTSASSAPAIIVQDAFSRGGAGASSENSSHTFELSDDFDFNVGRKQQMRVGALLESGRYQYFDQTNANGTFTFQSLDDYQAVLAGTPRLDESGREILPIYRIREGLVNTNFSVYQLGVYWQDDYRVNSRLSLSVGVRNEMQSLLDDKFNLMPRAGFTFTPKGNRTSIRGGYGMFYDWYDSSLYDQTLRVNGVAQKDLLILNAGYPDPYSGHQVDVQPGGRIQAAPDLKMPYVHQASIGIERQLTPNLSAQVNYQALRGRNQLRAININAPDALGIRPDQSVGNVTQFESTGRSTSDRLTFNASYRIPSKQIFLQGNYTLGSVKNHADSATSLPANNLDPDSEWGPSRQDVRHRVQAMINVPTVYGIRTTMNINAQSGMPYTITTGNDDNHDGVLNDRPVGVGRNTARGTATWTMSLRLSKVIGIGSSATGAGPGGGGFTGGGGRPGVSEQRGPGGRAGNGGGTLGSRYSIELFASADNLLNRINYSNFIGNMQSDYFLQPTAALAARRIQVGMGFRF